MSQINRNIMAISRRHTQYRGEKMEPHGLKASHTSYICKICNNPGISQDRLAQELCLNKSSVARQAAFLEEEGYITRTPAENDKRILELYPTEKATTLLPQIRTVLREWEAYVTADLTAEEIETLTVLLAKLKNRAAKWTEVF